MGCGCAHKESFDWKITRLDGVSDSDEMIGVSNAVAHSGVPEAVRRYYHQYGFSDEIIEAIYGTPPNRIKSVG